jgi:hypothetical protein
MGLDAIKNGALQPDQPQQPIANSIQNISSLDLKSDQ